MRNFTLAFLFTVSLLGTHGYGHNSHFNVIYKSDFKSTKSSTEYELYKVEETTKSKIPSTSSLRQKGTIQFWFETDKDYIPTGKKSDVVELLEIPGILNVSFRQNRNAIMIFVKWDDSNPDGNKEHIRILMPHFPGKKSTHFAVHWDTDEGILNAFLDGTPFYFEDARANPWVNPENSETKYVVIHKSNFKISDVLISDYVESAQAIKAHIPESQRGRLDHLLGAKELGSFQFQPAEDKLFMSYPFSDESEMEDWILEGMGKLEIEDGWLHARSLKPDGDNSIHGHFVVWNKIKLPENFYAEWEYQPDSEHGLSIVFFSAHATDKETIFDPDLKPRDGQFSQYVNGDIHSYHVSYHANTPGVSRKTANLRKNRGLFLLSNGPVGVLPGSRKIHKIALLKNGGQIQLAVDGKLCVEFEDNGNHYKEIYKDGFFGLRQMKWTKSKYRNLKVYEIE